MIDQDADDSVENRWSIDIDEQDGVTPTQK